MHLETQQRDIEERFNESHDSKTGRFAPKSGSGGGASEGGSGGGDIDSQISAVKEKMKTTSPFSSEGQELMKQLKELQSKKGESKPKEEKKPTSKTQEEKPKNDVTPEKQKQFEIIQKSNAMTDDYHTGIRQPSDIKSAKEAFKTKVSDNDDFLYPDFTKADGEKALKTGKVTVYSSKPIGAGGFVSPSKMMAQDYAGGGKVYSKEVSIDDVAWIDSNEGQFAKG